jgi:hypothetical protein
LAAERCATLAANLLTNPRRCECDGQRAAKALIHVSPSPLEVSKADSPAPPDDPQDAFAFVGDHGPSGMAMDAHGGVYVVWADWTPGERAIFFSAINAEAFSF